MPIGVIIANCATCALSLLILLVVTMRKICRCCGGMKKDMMNMEAMNLIKRRDKLADMNVIELIAEMFRKPKSAAEIKEMIESSRLDSEM